MRFKGGSVLILLCLALMGAALPAYARIALRDQGVPVTPIAWAIQQSAAVADGGRHVAYALTSRRGSVVKLWNKTTRRSRLIERHGGSYNNSQIHIAHDGSTVLYLADIQGGRRTGLRYWSRNTGQAVTVSSVDSATSFDMTPDGRFVAFFGQRDGHEGLLLWDTSAGTTTLIADESIFDDYCVECEVAVSDEGSEVVFYKARYIDFGAADCNMQVWHRDTRAVDQGPRNPSCDGRIQVSANGERVLFYRRHGFRGNWAVWDRPSSTTRRLEVKGEAVLLPDGTAVVYDAGAGRRLTVRRHDVEGGQERTLYRAYRVGADVIGAWAIASSPDSRWVALSESGWDRTPSGVKMRYNLIKTR